MTSEPAKHKLSRDFWIVLLTAAVAVLATFFAVRSRDGSPGVRQHHNLRLADERLPRIRTLLEADSRFKDVFAHSFTHQDGGITLRGSVESTDDLLKLMRVIAAENLPVAIWWQVHVTSEDQANK